MATKQTNCKTWSFTCGNETFLISAYTTNGRNSTKETCECRELHAKGTYSYMNRPWQTFKYDSALYDLANKLERIYPNHPEYREAVLKLRDDVEKGVREECDAMFNNFKKVFDNASPSLKKTLAESDIHLESTEQVESLTRDINALNAIRDLLS